MAGRGPFRSNNLVTQLKCLAESEYLTYQRMMPSLLFGLYIYLDRYNVIPCVMDELNELRPVKAPLNPNGEVNSSCPNEPRADLDYSSRLEESVSI